MLIHNGNIIKRRIFLLISFTIVFTNLFGQFSCSDSPKMNDYRNRTHNVIGLVPSNARITNGWSIGWSTDISHCSYMDSIRINGLYTNISPFQIFVAGMAIAIIPYTPFLSNADKKNEYEYDSISINNQLNGVSIGLFELGDDFCMQGVQITALYHSMGQLNGFSITSIGADYQSLNGLVISGIFNRTKKGKGLQIGLLNKAKEMQGVQIGLWNKIGKRGLPLINMSFKNNKTTLQTDIFFIR